MLRGSQLRAVVPLEPRIEIITESGCWIWMGALNRDGYGYVNGKAYGGRNVRVHRYMYQRKHGAIPSGRFVLHRCDVRCCVNPDHLFLGTPKENTQDMIRKGRRTIPMGKQRRHSKLTEEAVRFIRSSTMTQKALGKMFGVCQATISAVKIFTWKHVT